MWGNRRFLPHLSEAEIPPAGHRENEEFRCAAGGMDSEILSGAASLYAKKSGRISCRFWFVEKPWALT